MGKLIKQKSNIIFILALVVAIIVITTVYFFGKKQDEQFLAKSEQYDLAIQLMSSKEGDTKLNIKHAIKMLEKLKEDQPFSVAIARNLGMAYALSEDYNAASNEYKRAIELKPFLTTEPVFMLQFGEMLYFSDKRNEAKIVLEKAQTLSGPEVDNNYIARTNELLQSLSGMNNGG